MRYLILSDIHANLDALEAALDAADRAAWDRAIVLGDLVGYGADPNAVIDRVRALAPDVLIRGNHDKVAAGLDDAANFNRVARLAALWTRQALTPANLAFLRALPAGPAFVDDLIEACHGTPFDEDAYLFDAQDALRAFAALERPICFFGHTHLPVLFAASADGLEAVDTEPQEYREVALRPGWQYLVNPGSVGQPRDGDPRAAFAILDAGRPSITVHRVPYAVDAAQAKIRQAGLPRSLADRLAFGR